MAYNKILTAIGLMSGTSMDGIDCALIRSDGLDHVEPLAFGEYPYDAQFKRRIERALEEAKELTKSNERTKALSQLETEITERHGEVVANFLKKQSLKSNQIDLVGFHGQTVLHRPDLGFTVQLGDGHALACITGIPTVYDMRCNDMLHGGQGAPLVPVYHQAVARQILQQPKFEETTAEFDYPLAFVNIGGIANVSWVSKCGDLVAFDAGPGNALIDQWMQSKAAIGFDKDGLIASRGAVIDRLAERYMSHPFLKLTAPKSLDRSDFPPLAANEAELADGARTLAHISACAIIEAANHMPEPPKLWIICGGGRKNSMIMGDLEHLAAKLNDGMAITSDGAGLNGDAVEAEAWAYLAIRSFKGLPLTFPKTTGCKKPVSGGVLVRP